MTVSEWFSLIFCGVGLFFFLAGTVGFIRFPDILCRLHALTKADNLGLGLIVIGLIPQLSSLLDLFKLVLVWGLVIFSSAACAYLLASRELHCNSLSSKSKSPPEIKESKR
jgi:multicomponent Na+:H+ antiporter subunit G